MRNESGILLKSHVGCHFMVKNYITISFQQFTKTSNQDFCLARPNENLKTCMPVWFENLNTLSRPNENLKTCMPVWSENLNTLSRPNENLKTCMPVWFENLNTLK